MLPVCSAMNAGNYYTDSYFPLEVTIEFIRQEWRPFSRAPKAPRSSPFVFPPAKNLELFVFGRGDPELYGKEEKARVPGETYTGQYM